MAASLTGSKNTDGLSGPFRSASNALIISWIEYRVAYSGTSLGVFWPVVSISIFMCVLGVLFSQVMNHDLHTFMPHVAWGFAIWTFISSIVQTSGSVYISRKQAFLSGQLTLADFVYRTIFKSAIEFCFQAIPAALVTVFLYRYIDFNFLWVVPLIILTFCHCFWVLVVFGIICARFGDVAQIIPLIVRVGFLATPIIWVAESDRGNVIGIFLLLNPFYHLLEPLRGAILSQPPSIVSLSISVVTAIVGLTAAHLLYQRFARQAVLWV